MQENKMFNYLIKERGDSEELVSCMKKTVEELLDKETTSETPGVLLGKIQSGKTRAFIGIMALAFDSGYDVSVILTKGTKALVKQTVQRMEGDFKHFIENDQIQVFDIMTMPDNLTAYERNQKLIIVAKKEINNMRRILDNLVNVYPDLANKKILIVDDEADFASISFRKHAEAVEVGVISSKIDELRRFSKEIDYLQVTATPYSLYLQPKIEENSFEYAPKRPAFTVLVPTHDKYIGGEFYFEKSKEPNTVAAYVYEEVSLEERDVLKTSDGRRLKLEDVLSSPKISVLRRAIMNFIVGATIRRLQQLRFEKKQEKYAFVAHSEISKNSHDWQHEVVRAIVDGFQDIANNQKTILNNLISDSYHDLAKSIKSLDIYLPTMEDVCIGVNKSLVDEFIMVTIVNSDKDVEELLDSHGQLKLRNPMNIFIGGQILDRGITVNNLIGFYYGRNPKKFQQDTVLQHSRMYGARPLSDLAVTRFYTTRDIYEVMNKIHDFDTALREAFKKGDHENGVYFIRKDISGKLAPCSPNKLLLSSLVSLQPYRRLLPIGFQTGYKTHISKNIEDIDNLINEIYKDKTDDEVVVVDLSDANKIVDLIERTLDFSDNPYQWDWNAFRASIEHLSKNSPSIEQRNKVMLLVRTDRELKRIKIDESYSDAPDTPKTEGAIAKENAIDLPMLMLFRQNGTEENGWRGTPFWWPVMVAPKNTKTTIYARDTINS